MPELLFTKIGAGIRKICRATTLAVEDKRARRKNGNDWKASLAIGALAFSGVWGKRSLQEDEWTVSLSCALV